MIHTDTVILYRTKVFLAATNPDHKKKVPGWESIKSPDEGKKNKLAYREIHFLLYKGKKKSIVHEGLPRVFFFYSVISKENTLQL